MGEDAKAMNGQLIAEAAQAGIEAAAQVLDKHGHVSPAEVLCIGMLIYEALRADAEEMRQRIIGQPGVVKIIRILGGS